MDSESAGAKRTEKPNFSIVLDRNSNHQILHRPASKKLRSHSASSSSSNDDEDDAFVKSAQSSKKKRRSHSCSSTPTSTSTSSPSSSSSRRKLESEPSHVASKKSKAVSSCSKPHNMTSSQKDFRQEFSYHLAHISAYECRRDDFVAALTISSTVSRMAAYANHFARYIFHPYPPDPTQLPHPQTIRYLADIVQAIPGISTASEQLQQAPAINDANLFVDDMDAIYAAISSIVNRHLNVLQLRGESHPTSCSFQDFLTGTLSTDYDLESIQHLISLLARQPPSDPPFSYPTPQSPLYTLDDFERDDDADEDGGSNGNAPGSTPPLDAELGGRDNDRDDDGNNDYDGNNDDKMENNQSNDLFSATGLAELVDAVIHIPPSFKPTAKPRTASQLQRSRLGPQVKDFESFLHAHLALTY